MNLDHLRLRLPDRSGSRFLVTGATAGLGYFTAEALAVTGAQVWLGARDPDRARRAARAIGERVPRAKLETVALDLTDADSITHAAAIIGSDRLDGLVLNAGTTRPNKRRSVAKDGNELTLATNTIGHARLTAELLPAMLGTGNAGAAPPPRIVGLGSLATLLVGLDAGDLQSERRYRPFRAYGLSKHAMHGMIFELERRLRAAGADVQALLAHPGYAVDALSPLRPGIVEPGPFERLPFAQGKASGALPTLRALLDPGLPGGTMLGPRAVLRGSAVVSTPVRSSRREEFGRFLFGELGRWADVDFGLR